LCLWKLLKGETEDLRKTYGGLDDCLYHITGQPLDGGEGEIKMTEEELEDSVELFPDSWFYTCMRARGMGIERELIGELLGACDRLFLEIDFGNHSNTLPRRAGFTLASLILFGSSAFTFGQCQIFRLIRDPRIILRVDMHAPETKPGPEEGEETAPRPSPGPGSAPAAGASPHGPAGRSAAKAALDYYNFVQETLNKMVGAVLERRRRRQEKQRAMLTFLIRLKETPEQCYRRLLEARAAKPLASKYKLLLNCPAAADDFLKGLAWDKALAAARQLRPTPHQRKPQQRRESAARRFAARLVALKRTEFPHPLGTFRIIRKPGGLFGDAPEKENS